MKVKVKVKVGQGGRFFRRDCGSCDTYSLPHLNTSSYKFYYCFFEFTMFF